MRNSKPVLLAKNRSSLTPKQRRFVTLVAQLCPLVFVISVLAFPQLWAGADPLATNLAATYQPPGAAHFLGTDQIGRDIYSRIIYGARSSILSGVLAACAAAGIGALLGVLVALLRGVLKTIALRCVDAAIALPEFLLALLLIAYLGTGFWAAVLAVTFATAPGYTKIAIAACGRALQSPAYVSARVLGVGRLRRFSAYLLPEVLRPLLAVMVLGIGTAMLMIAGFTFLGIGLSSENVDWGVMLQQSKLFAFRAWWALVFPGLALVCSVILCTWWGKKLQQKLEFGA